ncbi:MAG: hypothetical protein FJY55_06785, partial [Betaproteobacteria bacterium]|nr:hypothetical protein [Betaproteobacteria bacterium]
MTEKLQLLAPALDDAAIAEARSLLGMPMRVEQWNYEASRDSIRHYAWGLGDDNPLYCEPEYARQTRWKGIIAPPTFFFGIFDAVVAPGLPDIQWIYSGVDCEFFEPMRRDDEITATAEYIDAKELPARQSGRMLVQTGDVRYANQHGRLTTKVLSHTFRIARMTAAGGLRYEARAEHQYTEAQLKEIETATLNEQRRGAEVRYWEDVQVGEQLLGTVRGPINRLDMTCYYAGAVGTSGYKSTKLKWMYADWARRSPEKLPNNYDPSYYAAAVSPSIGHQDLAIATTEIGMPGAYDNGPQRIGMLIGSVTNWMGDDGILLRYSARLRLPVIFGDTNFFKGSVSSKR